MCCQNAKNSHHKLGIMVDVDSERYPLLARMAVLEGAMAVRWMIQFARCFSSSPEELDEMFQALEHAVKDMEEYLLGLESTEG